MAKGSAEETSKGSTSKEEAPANRYAFNACGPRNLSSPNWRDLINSSWKDGNYKRTVMACFIQAAYLLELDRQENRSKETALAPRWWLPFKYKLVHTLIDERDGSMFGALLEWDSSAALADWILVRPSGAPKAVLALRGTLLKSQTLRRDIEDDLRFLAWESLKGSVRFKVALEAIRSIAKKYGSSNVCIAGHSLGAGFAFQVGKALAKEGIHVEAHLFNPPSLSIAMILKNIGEKAEVVLNKFKWALPSNSSNGETKFGSHAEERTSALGLKSWLPYFNGNSSSTTVLQQWVPHLYVNNSDYICCHYTDPAVTNGNGAVKEVNAGLERGQVAAKLFVMSKGNQKFLEAHRLEQWWSEDLDLQLALHDSKLISRQLKSLYSLPAPQNPRNIGSR